MPGWLTGRAFFLSLASSLRVTEGYGGSSPAVPGLVYLPLHLGKLRMADDQSGDFLGLIVEPLAQYGDRVRRLAVYMSEREAIGIDDMTDRARRRRCVHCVPQIHHHPLRPLLLIRLSTNQRPRRSPQGPLSFSAHQIPAQSFPLMSKDPTLKPTKSAYW